MTDVIQADEKLLDEALAEGTPVLVDFWAPWCPQCRAMANTVERLAEAVAGKAAVLAINVESNPAVAERYRVLTLPAVLLLRGGEVRTRLDGFKRLPAMLEAFRAEL